MSDVQTDGWVEQKSFQVPVHKFEEEAELIGKFIERKEINGGFKTNQLIIEREDGEKVAVWESFQLAQLFENIEPNTDVKIVFTGKQDIGDGKSVSKFQVFTK